MKEEGEERSPSMKEEGGGEITLNEGGGGRGTSPSMKEEGGRGEHHPQ